MGCNDKKNDNMNDSISGDNTSDIHQKDLNKIKQTKSKFVKRIVILGIIFTTAFLTIEYFLEPILPNEYIMLIQSIQASILGYFVIEVISNAFHELTYSYLKETSKSIKILIRILGAIVVIAIIISYLSNDPIVAASIGTITGLVVGFASQNIIGNIIAGLYLALIRPFKLGDEITVFNNTGLIYDIGLISTKLKTNENKIVLVPNSAMVTTTIVLNNKL